MTVAVTPIFPVIAAQAVHGDIGFQTGSVVSARVLKLLPDNQVRISIGNVAIDVQSEVPLQAGQVLQLAVSQTSDGIRLAVVTPQPTSGAAAPAMTNTGEPLDIVTLAPGAQASLATILSTSKVVLTVPEQLAVATAAQTAATQQAGLSTLFANLGVAASLENLPMPLQQAVANLLAQRPPLDANLTGDEVKSAFQNSGLFLEASLASGAVTPSAMPDMKAALIVFRQVLQNSLGDVPDGAPSPATAQPAITATAQPAAAATLAPALMPEMLVQDDLLQQAGLFAVEDFVDFGSKAAVLTPAASPPEAAARAAAAGTALNMLQETLQGGAKGATALNPALDDGALLNLLLPRGKAPNAAPLDDVVVRSNIPPPPLRGALPTAQPVALPTLPSDAPLAGTLHHLLADTDAALARQTLMQVASLPDRIDGTAAKLDAAAPRWNFEIPFAVANGTAVAQFEISRDGSSDSEAEAASRVWRARFSLDVEPAGPVHALVSLAGDRTSVRMWAERPATAMQLQAGAAQLSQALLRAELTPGDIVIREGAPVQVAPATAGHFLDRAL
ncbi:MAG: flagellar hook-length control protein FliK [Tardiphaga sp.]